MLKILHNPLQSIKLISLEKYFEEMVKLYELNSFPKVLLLKGKKGIGKFTLIFHFLNYIYTKKGKNSYNTNDKLIDINKNLHLSGNAKQTVESLNPRKWGLGIPTHMNMSSFLIYVSLITINMN